jgi:hypothetical protein
MEWNTFSFSTIVSIIQTSRWTCYQQGNLQRSSSMHMATRTSKQELNCGILLMYWHGLLVISRRLFTHHYLVYLNYFLMRDFKHTSQFVYTFHCMEWQVTQHILQISFHLMMTKYNSSWRMLTRISICFLCPMKQSFSRMVRSYLSWP